MADERDVIGEAIATFGDNAQMVVACEELSELQKEICKALRGTPDYHHIAEEVKTVSPPKPAKPAPADHCEGCRWGNNGTEVCCLPQCLREVCR